MPNTRLLARSGKGPVTAGCSCHCHTAGRLSELRVSWPGRGDRGQPRKSNTVPAHMSMASLKGPQQVPSLGAHSPRMSSLQDPAMEMCCSQATQPWTSC